ncbi:MAG: cation transporter [Thermodesulfovibrionales bacterium]|nr:cation transporter [Thermodesulfovibrionales bacterium]
MPEFELKIEGMSCQHCVMRVKKALESVKGVKSLMVEIGRARVDCDCGKEDLIAAITKAGYSVKEDSNQ